MDSTGLANASHSQLKEKKKKKKRKEQASASLSESQAQQHTHAPDGSDAPDKKKKKKKKNKAKHTDDASYQPQGELSAEPRLPAEPATPAAVQLPATASPPQAWTHHESVAHAPEPPSAMLTDILAGPPTAYAGIMPADHHLVYHQLQQPIDVINPILDAMVPVAHSGEIDLGLGGGALIPDGAADMVAYDGALDGARDLHTDGPVGPFVDLLEPRLSWRKDQRRTNVKSGRFSQSEKETIRAAAVLYAQSKNLPTDSFEWLFSTTKSNKDVSQGAWIAIASALPQRTMKQVWAAGTRLLHKGNYKGAWTAEEDAALAHLVEQHGAKWKRIGDAMGRLPDSCRDRWRSYIKPGEAKKTGKWSEDELQRLQQAVADYKQHKAAAQHVVADAAPDRRIVKDDVDWAVVADKVGTRSNIQCLHKWYEVAPKPEDRGVWGPGDDVTLVRGVHDAVQHAGAAYEYQVDWDQLVAGREGTVARRRWRDLTKQVRGRQDLELPELAAQMVALPSYRDWEEEQVAVL